MSRLVKGLFVGHSNIVGLFGLLLSNLRHHEVIHNGGWYNAAGEKLGWGDLNRGDLRRIVEELQDDEVFVVLYEDDSTGVADHIEKLAKRGVKTTMTRDVPGVDYVASKCTLILTKGNAYFVKRSVTDTAEGRSEFYGMQCNALKSEDVKAFLESKRSA